MTRIQEAMEAFRSLPESEAVFLLLRERLGLPENYAEQEQDGKLSEEHREALIVYRGLTQEAV